MSDRYDVIVIGGGPGGYVAAIRAAQLGLKTACIEKRSTLGGVCLNVGCIPSKALLNISHKYAELESLKDLGITADKTKVDLSKVMGVKNGIVADLTKGIDFLFKKNKVQHILGEGSLVDANTVLVNGKDSISADHIILATGSESTPFPGIAIDEKTVVTSTGALNFEKAPKHLVVIGGGVIGIELGSVWKRLGSRVTVVEYLDRITPTMDMDVCRELKKLLEKQGIIFKLSTKVVGVEKVPQGITLRIQPAIGGAVENVGCDAVLVSIGRRAYTDGLNLEAVGIQKDEKGRIKVDEHLRTSVPNIYAIGDVIEGAMLAHKAEEEGVFVAEVISGQQPHINYNAIPNVIYTHPEAASVGLTEDQLKESGRAYTVGKFPFSANSRARANMSTEGFVKILADAQTDEVLGVHIVGDDAGTIIAEAALAMEYRASAEDIARTCHAHPTLNEAVKEAALSVAKRAIHM